MPATSAAPGPVGGLVVLTRDAGLFANLRLVLGGAHELLVVDHETELAERLLATHAAVALIDAAAVAGPIEKLTADLAAQFPDLVLVVAGEGAAQAALASQVSDGTVYRFLHRPVSEQRLRLFVEAALRRHDEVQHAAAPASPAPPRMSRAVLAATGGAALLLVAGSAIWLAQRGREDLRPPEDAADNAGQASPAVPVPLSPTAPGARASDARLAELDRLLSTAEQAMLGGRLDEAGRLIDAARAIQSDHLRVAFLTVQLQRERERLQRSAATRRAEPPQAAAAGNAGDPAQAELRAQLLGLAVTAIAEGRFEAAERSLDAARTAGADAELIAARRRDLQQARIAAEAARITSLSRELALRLQRQQFVEPAGDSAEFFYQSLLREAPGHPATLQAQQLLVDGIAAAARSALARADLSQAEKLRGELARIDPAAPAAADLQRDIEAARAGNAQAAVVAASTLERTHYVAPRYPVAAERAGRGGWVDLEFTVAADGAVRAAQVLRSEPAGLFDAAALEAVRRWRYRPVERDGQKIEQRAQLRVRFEMER